MKDQLFKGLLAIAIALVICGILLSNALMDAGERISVGYQIGGTEYRSLGGTFELKILDDNQ